MSTPILNELKSRVGHTPMTDPRSLGGSLLFHGVLIAILSLFALGAALRQTPEGPKAIRGELGPIDNRANQEDTSGGGSPGEMNAERVAAAVASLAPPSPSPTSPESPPTRDPAADALLSEIIPTMANPAPSNRQSLPGPQTSSMAVVAGPSPTGGGGGGSGGGVGGGIGRGVGPGTEFFGARDHAASFAYVIDCSGSMATRGSLDIAKRELIVSLNQLAPDAQFTAIFYNLHATILTDPLGRRGMMNATVSNKGRVGIQLAQVVPDGGTDHMLALRTALELKPEVMFFLTDADLMSQSDVTSILKDAGATRIQAVEFGRGMELVGENPLRRLSTATGGTYRYIDVTRFPKTR